ncbi:helix-turn-helix domain-containing protein [Candidatus Poriferisodalis sp.]|uniref:helix-turn-helix domain-containing protein n=1 Tax=Candidatus Poriferisodalis sp. TaxID=3101277 RepID=UPI003B010A7A
MIHDRRRVDALVGARLRTVRKRRRMTLGDVEAVSGGEFRISVLGAYERGARGVGVHRLLRLAEIYGVPPAELLPPERSESALDGSHACNEAAATEPPGHFPPDAVL